MYVIQMASYNHEANSNSKPSISAHVTYSVRRVLFSDIGLDSKYSASVFLNRIIRFIQHIELNFETTILLWHFNLFSCHFETRTMLTRKENVTGTNYVRTYLLVHTNTHTDWFFSSLVKANKRLSLTHSSCQTSSFSVSFHGRENPTVRHRL